MKEFTSRLFMILSYDKKILPIDQECYDILHYNHLVTFTWPKNWAPACWLTHSESFIGHRINMKSCVNGCLFGSWLFVIGFL